MNTKIEQGFLMIAVTANSAGDTLSPREAVDVISGVIDTLKLEIVAWEKEERGKGQRLARK